MTKGKWIVSLLQRVAEGTVTPKQAVSFLGWRLGRSRNPIEIGGILFEDVDRTTWGLIATILLGREYNAPGYGLGSNHTVVDVGAHRGVFLGYAAKRTQAPILAIEPDPDNFRSLQRFVEVNRFPNAELLNAAVAADSGQVRLYRSPESSRHTLTGFDQKSGESLDQSIVVTAISLDDVLARFEVVDLLKMDCEGAEYGILASCSDQALGKINSLVAELHGLGVPGNRELALERLSPLFAEVSIRETTAGLGLLFAQ